MNRRGMDIKEFIYYIAYIVYVIFGIISASFYSLYVTETINRIVFFFCSLALVSTLFFDSNFIKRKIIIRAVIIIVLSFLVFIASNSERRRSLLVLLAFIYFGKNIIFERAAKITVVLDTLLLLFIIVSAKVGIIEDFIVEHGERTRQFLGFLYALNAPTIWSNVVFLVLYVRKEKISHIELLCLFAVSYFLYQATLSRLTFFMTAAVILGGWLLKHRSFYRLVQKKLIMRLLCLVFPLCIGCSIYLSVNYNYSYAQINTILEGRLSSAQDAINTYGISLLGQPIPWIGNGVNAYGKISIHEYNYVDNMYIQLLVQFGVIAFSIYAVGYLFLEIKAYKRRNCYLVIILTLLALHALIDDLILNLIYNTFWIIFFARTNTEKDSRSNLIVVT